jgi:serine/threonine-protein kinase
MSSTLIAVSRWARSNILRSTPRRPRRHLDVPLDGEPQSLVASEAQERDPVLSSDEHWLAYASNESGRLEVYVRPFPNVDAGKWLVSTGGGGFPVWSPNGRECSI